MDASLHSRAYTPANIIEEIDQLPIQKGRNVAAPLELPLVVGSEHIPELSREIRPFEKVRQKQASHDSKEPLTHRREWIERVILVSILCSGSG